MENRNFEFTDYGSLLRYEIQQLLSDFVCMAVPMIIYGLLLMGLDVIIGHETAPKLADYLPDMISAGLVFYWPNKLRGCGVPLPLSLGGIVVLSVITNQMKSDVLTIMLVASTIAALCWRVLKIIYVILRLRRQ